MHVLQIFIEKAIGDVTTYVTMRQLSCFLNRDLAPNEENAVQRAYFANRISTIRKIDQGYQRH